MADSKRSRPKARTVRGFRDCILSSALGVIAYGLWAGAALSQTEQQTVPSYPDVQVTSPMAIPGTQDCSSYYPPDVPVGGNNAQVAVKFDIDATGVTQNVRVLHSSGSAEFDDAAVKCVTERWRYTPKQIDGKPVTTPDKMAVVIFAMLQNSPWTRHSG